MSLLSLASKLLVQEVIMDPTKTDDNILRLLYISIETNGGNSLSVRPAVSC